MRMPSKRRPGGTGARRDRRPAAKRPESPNSDYLVDAVNQNWPCILAAYRRFADQRPVVLYDIQERRVYVYPYAGFSEELSEQSQQTLKDQYERAVRDNKVVVFVRDNEQRRLVSFSMNVE
jgi:hypothetical protein